MATGEIVARAHACENAIDQADLGACRRHKAADLRHQNNERDLPDVSRFAGHVRAGHNRQSDIFIQGRVVRDKLFFDEILIEHRMTTVSNHEPQ